MAMSNEEICREYRQAKDQRKQIGILADQNEMPKSAIVEILRASGEKVTGNYKPKRVETAVPATKPETPETPRVVKDGKVIMLEDILDIFIGVLTDYREAQEVDRDTAARTTLAYMAGVADAYEAIYGPIVR